MQVFDAQRDYRVTHRGITVHNILCFPRLLQTLVPRHLGKPTYLEVASRHAISTSSGTSTTSIELHPPHTTIAMKLLRMNRHLVWIYLLFFVVVAPYKTSGTVTTTSTSLSTAVSKFKYSNGRSSTAHRPTGVSKFRSVTRRKPSAPIAGIIELTPIFQPNPRPPHTRLALLPAAAAAHTPHRHAASSPPPPTPCLTAIPDRPLLPRT